MLKFFGAANLVFGALVGIIGHAWAPAILMVIIGAVCLIVDSNKSNGSKHCGV